MEDEEPWSLTVVRAQGLRLMRPEKSWRPIITISIDQHHHHETVLGSDGQNPNLKSAFHIQGVNANSRVEIKVWHRSQSKKKGKKRVLVAMADHSLGELLKRQDSNPNFEVRLICQSAQKRCVASRGKPQNGAHVLLKLKPPRSLDTFTAVLDDEELSNYAHFETLTAPSSPSTSSSSSFPEDEITPLNPPTTLRRRRVKGYKLYSDDSGQSSDCRSSDGGGGASLHPGGLHFGCDDDDDNISCEQDEIEVTVYSPDSIGSMVYRSELPQYTEKIDVISPLSRNERFLATFTMYSELKEATVDSDFEKVFSRLQQEWTFIGGLLVALAAVDTAVFAISPGSLFPVSKYAQDAVAASSIASGVGISCDAWFLLRYNWADLHTFRTRAKDVYGSYFFFSLSARVPAMAMLTSSLSLMAFLGLVAFSAWPEAVVVMCILFGVIMTLQFLIYGAHWCVNRVVGAGRTVWKVLLRLVGRSAALSQTPPEYAM